MRLAQRAWRFKAHGGVLGGVFATLVMGTSTTAVAAQVTYNVFPAQLSAQSSSPAQPTNGAEAARVTLAVRDSTLRYIVTTLARQAHLNAMFDGGEPVFAKHASVHLTDVTVAEAFKVALRGTGLTAKFMSDGETVVIRASVEKEGTATERLATGIVVGRVTDSASGAGLGGASIKVNGTRVAAISSDSGNFTLRDVPAGEQVLSVRLFGYKPVDRTVTVVDSQRSVVRVVMVAVPTVLSGVVTTAAGTQRKIEVGSDITTLNVDSIMTVAPIQSVTDLLETRVPGLTVLHSDGVPGDPSRIRIRGAGSVQLNNDPIVILDGVRVYSNQSDPRNQNLAPASFGNGAINANQKFNAPSPLDQIDPNNIASIEVLKGPSATAIYGSDAASGVIVVTTKHGRNGPTHWLLGVGAGINWLPGDWPTNYYRFGSAYYGNANGLCSWSDITCRVDSLVPFQALNDPRYTIFTHGNDQTADLTVSGGDQALQYSLTGSAAGDLGNVKIPAVEQARYDSLYGPIPNSLVRPVGYSTWGIGGSLRATPYHTLSVTLQSSLFSGHQRHSSLENAVNQLQGAYISPIYGLVSYGAMPNPGSPLLTGEYERISDDQLTSNNALTANWQPVSWLSTINVTAGINTIQRTDGSYIPYGIFYGNYSGSSPTGQSASDTSGFYGLGRGTSREQTLTAGTNLPLLRQKVTVAVGGNLYTTATADFSVATDQLSPGVSAPQSFTTDIGCTGSATLCNSPTSQSSAYQSTYGWYVQPQINVASRFFAAPGFRLDGGNGAATSAGSVGGLSAFPKMDFSYVAIDRQSGRPAWGLVSLFRPRLALGLAGTQPGPADKLRLYNVGSYNERTAGGVTLLTNNAGCEPTVTLDGSSFVPAVCIDALGNTQLRPERSSEIEGGFDLVLWQNRVSVTYTQYNKTRHDAILGIPVGASVYGNSNLIQKNIGVIRNTGTELTANATVMQTRAFGWTVGANLSNDNNLVVRLNPGQPPIVLNSEVGAGGLQSRVEAGYPIFAEFARPIVGYVDANHNGLIDPGEIRLGDSAVYVGQPDPKYQFNLTSDFALLNGHLTIHTTFAYQDGMTQYNSGFCSSTAALALPNDPNSTPATQAAITAAGCPQPGAYASNTPVGILQRINTFRFQDLSINYEVPRTVSSWFRVPRMTVAVQGSNLALHTNYQGLDPNVNAFSTVGIGAGDETADEGQIPEPRTWWLRLTLGN